MSISLRLYAWAHWYIPHTLGGLLIEAIKVAGEFRLRTVVEEIGGQDGDIDIRLQFGESGGQIDQRTGVPCVGENTC